MWIARDGERNGGNDDAIAIYDEVDGYDTKAKQWCGAEIAYINSRLYPEVKNGECYELILGEKVEG